VIMRDSVEKGYEATRNAGDGATKAIVDAHLQSTDIKVIKVGVERCIALHREKLALSCVLLKKKVTDILLPKMSIFMLFEPFPEKVPNVSKDNENEVGNISCNQVKIGRLVHDGLRDSGARRVTTDVTMGVISDASELGIPFGFFLPAARMVGG